MDELLQALMAFDWRAFVIGGVFVGAIWLTNYVLKVQYEADRQERALDEIGWDDWKSAS